MNEELSKQLDTIEVILKEKSNQLKEITKKIENNKKLSFLIEEFNIHKEEYHRNGKISDEFISSKTNLYEHPLIYEYHLLESEISDFVLYFNKKMASLLDNKACKNPTNVGF